MELLPMAHSTPEREGIPSGAIASYLSEIKADNLAMHSLMVVRHSRIVFESYWKPFDADFRHRLYSCSKSFVSVAVGCLIDQGLLRLDDPVIRFFPDKIAGRTIDPCLKAATIRDLLRMSAPYTNGANYSPADPAWEDTFFTDEVSHVPGAAYSYCTSGTTMLCAIIRRVTGKDFLDVLRPAFDEIGISRDIFCVRTPEGIQWGGSGVCATAREFAKFANLCMHYGEYEGRQLLPRDYLMEATSRQIDNSIDAANPDQAQGYGYQFWMLRHGGFAFFGMGGQYALCFPKEDLLIVTTGYEELTLSGRWHALFGNLWHTVFPALRDQPLPEDEKALQDLNALADTLELAHVQGKADSPIREKVNGKTYFMRKNAMGMKWIRFSFDEDGGNIRYENLTGEHTLFFGMCRNVRQEFPEKYWARNIGQRAEKGYDCFVSAAWTMPDCLMIHCHVADIYLGQLRLSVGFSGNTVTLKGVKHAEWFMDEYQGFASGEMM